MLGVRVVVGADETSVYVAVDVADCVSPLAVAEHVRTVVPVKGPNVAGLAVLARGEPLAVQLITAPAVDDDTTGETEVGNVSEPGLNVGVATVGVLVASV
jgi:hypothetical protein